MKLNCLLFVCFCCIQALQMKAQDDPQPKTITVNPDLFSKGKFIWNLERNFSYWHYSHYSDGVKYNETNNTSFKLGTDYVFRPHWAIGADVSARFSGVTNGIDTKNRDWSAYLNLTYGTQLNTNVGAYLKLGAGIGREKDIITNTSGGTNEFLYKDLNFRSELGFPVSLDGGPVRLDPYLYYKRTCTDFADGEESTNRFGGGLKLIAGLSCGESECDSKRGYQQSRSLFTAGSQFIDYQTKTMFAAGNIKTDYNQVPNTVESDFSRFHFNSTYGYYFLDKVYGALGVKYQYDQSKPGSQPGYVFTNTEYLITPKIGVHIPADPPLGNFFIEGAYGLGQEISKTDDNGSVTKSKDKIRYFGVMAGDVIFFGENVGLVIKAGYSQYTNESITTPAVPEQRSKGFGTSFGVRFAF